MGKILVGNRHWGSIKLHLDRPKNSDEPFIEWEQEIPGHGNVQGQSFGYIEIDEDGFNKWLKTNPDLVQNGTIFKFKAREERLLREKAMKNSINLARGYPIVGQPFRPSFKSGNN